MKTQWGKFMSHYIVLWAAGFETERRQHVEIAK
jgi:hypothetical protein